MAISIYVFIYIYIYIDGHADVLHFVLIVRLDLVMELTPTFSTKKKNRKVNTIISRFFVSCYHSYITVI